MDADVNSVIVTDWNTDHTSGANMITPKITNRNEYTPDIIEPPSLLLRRYKDIFMLCQIAVQPGGKNDTKNVLKPI